MYVCVRSGNVITDVHIKLLQGIGNATHITITKVYAKIVWKQNRKKTLKVWHAIYGTFANSYISIYTNIHTLVTI